MVSHASRRLQLHAGNCAGARGWTGAEPVRQHGGELFRMLHLPRQREAPQVRTTVSQLFLFSYLKLCKGALHSVFLCPDAGPHSSFAFKEEVAFQHKASRAITVVYYRQHKKTVAKLAAGSTNYRRCAACPRGSTTAASTLSAPTAPPTRCPTPLNRCKYQPDIGRQDPLFLAASRGFAASLAPARWPLTLVHPPAVIYAPNKIIF